ncbi:MULTISPECIES: AI-2E family transporter [Ralstonia solanacearum species complex]|uniref:AI-2E family transporter n=4 Tax=Ralstonia solanacearum species complex TaxID=3116862 RepID=A0A0K1ZIA3_RALSL|nr:MULTISPECIES: AI-2E family transporter [Ralstonia]AKZ25713.1 ABC transporter permease [Ralstonia solanacearum]APF86113.1 AI-2E family transporter [Ralstonia solanacearum FJAT-1458]ARS56974.1 AI-2E family transporter [Ralstonia solanacearum FJAT-91]ESS47303.1 ABC transporter permease [Ralstonia solanacearum SD54]AGH85034.1 Putative permease often clustered with de novo purine synthesis [Ralstonia pseudosolanacearum FQY_4]
MNAPLLTQDTKRTLAWIAVAVAFLALLKLLAPTLTPFVFAGILSYILHPGVEWLQRHRVPRVLGVFLMILLLTVVAVALMLLILAVLQREIPAIREQLPGMLSKLNAAVTPRLAEMGVHVRFDFPGLRKLLTEQLAASPEDVMSTALNYLRVSGSAAVQVLGIVFLVPIVMFYLLMDWNMLIRRLEGAVPRRWISKTRELAAETDGLLSQYLRGQIIVMLVLAAYYSAGLALAGFDVALPIGIFTGLAVFIPYIGFGIGLILAILSALLQFGNLYGLLAVAVVYGVGQVLEGFYLTPRLVGERIGLHPLAVILALLAFGQLFGFFGILLALPISAVLLVGLRQIRQLYLGSKLYRD